MKAKIPLIPGSLVPGKLKFLSCKPRYEYAEDEKTGKRKKTGRQETTDDGTPIWNITAKLEQDDIDCYGINVDIEEQEDNPNKNKILVAVAMDQNPAKAIQLEEGIAFKDVVIVSEPRKFTYGRWERLIAKSVVRVRRDKRKQGGKDV